MRALRRCCILAFTFSTSVLAQVPPTTANGPAFPAIAQKAGEKVVNHTGGWYRITQVFFNSGGAFGVLGAPSKCGGNGWWGVDASTPQGRIMMDTLISAYHGGKTVWMYCDGTVFGWDRIVNAYVQ